MSDKEKLVELLDDIQARGEDFTDYEIYGMRVPDTVSNEDVASYLIAHGVTVQELDGCFRCKDSQQMTVTISNKLVDGVNTGWLGGNLPAKFCPFCGRSIPQPPKGE